ARRAQPLYGLGLLEAVPAETIRAMADPDDKNKDGISGRFLTFEGRIGRFGWKANHPTIESFVMDAFLHELGVRPGEGAAIPEVVRNVVMASRFMAPPKANRPTEQTERGKQLFLKVGCGSCHTPTLKTGPASSPALENITIEAYSDMLLHDIGRGKELPTKPGQASRHEYRTPPLWGLGKLPPPFFHDHRAGTIEEAIDLHEGEALKVRDRYKALPREARLDVLAFLRSL
ncbi:MAG TPA: di-heme oxidoredictase family protein, partial [Fimbriimonadaceae bacterium]|nr:di-heme oxidoredictase family protein [Fimbriimonadaceae bacterium]